MKSFLQIVVDNLITRAGGIHNLGQYTLVFPMQRAGLFVKQYISQKIEQSKDKEPVVLPHLTTIDSLVDTLCPLLPNDEITSVCQLYEIYERHTSHTLPIDAFYGWGVQLLNDFSSVDMALLDGKDIMHYTSTIKRYDEMIIDDETRKRLEEILNNAGQPNSVREYFTSLWEALPNIYQEFCDEQIKQGVGTRGTRTAWVIKHFQDESIQQRIAGRTYVFIGFNYLLAAEWKLMDLMMDQALYYWDDDENFQLDDNVYRFVHKNKDHFPNALNQEELSAADSHPSVSAIACQSSAAQAQYVYEWLKEHYHTGEKTAVVVADESMLQPVVYALPEYTITDEETTEEGKQKNQINITKGYPLRSTQLFSQVCSLMDESVERSVEADKFLPEIIAELEQFYHKQYNSIKGSWQAILWAEAYYQIQVVLRDMQLLMQNNQFVKDKLAESRVIRNLVRRQLEQVNIPFQGDPITDIQIIGVLETRLLDFDHVLILNVEEGVVPAIKADRSFLPYDLRREYKMATREEDTQIYAYNFFRLFRRAKDVTLMFSDSFTDKGKRTMSRFLMQMLCSPNYSVTRYRLTETAKVTPYALGTTIFTEEDKVPDHLSPSAISEYIECPRWFYLDKIRHLTESDIAEVMLPPNVIGDLLHCTLKTAYLDIFNVPKGKNRKFITPTEIKADMISDYLSDPDRLSQALDTAYQEENDKFFKHHLKNIDDPYVRTDHEAENHAIIAMAQKVLEKDKDTTPFTMIWMEHEVITTINGIKLKGVIDRLDMVEEGDMHVIRVMDYKTGSFDVKKISFTLNNLFSDTEKRYALQTLIYSEMLRQNLPSAIATSNGAKNAIRPQLLFTRKLSKEGYLTYEKDKDNKNKITDYVGDIQFDFLLELENKLEEIKNNMSCGQEFPMQEDLSICSKSYCPFHLLCGREKKQY